MSYDPKCHSLAEEWLNLDDYRFASTTDREYAIREVAQAIQDAIEDTIQTLANSSVLEDRDKYAENEGTKQ